PTPERTPTTTEPVDTPEPPPAPATTEPETTSEPESPAPPPTPLTRDPAPAQGPITGDKIVVIDPGHNGANAANPDIINALVPAGFGQTKPCNTTGTSTDAGYPEHDFTWGVANYLRPMLEAEGITVVMTRDSDDGVGPCVDKRAAIGNDAGADVVVSIHGDGDEPSANGFYVMTAEQDPAGAEMAARSQSLAVDVRDGLRSAGLSPSDHLGSEGLWPRNDLAGLNLSERPTVMIEAGNMRNSADAALMTSDAGQQQVAQGLANGVLSYLSAG
ncbi:N-acetylmuramoyl-L-alanine amidase, partial [Nakamurella sp. GG22]